MLNKKVDVFDFDGTLVSINSFHLFLIYLGFSYFFRLKFVALAKLGFMMLSRLTKQISHLEFKARTNEFGLLLGKDDIWVFLKLLSLFRRFPVVSALKCSYESPDSWCVIATAAPYAYMRYISLLFPVDLVVAFAGPANSTSSCVDNIGLNKLINVSAHLNIDLPRLNILYTDHIDDLPLALITDNVFLVKPDRRLVDALITRSVKFKVI